MGESERVWGTKRGSNLVIGRNGTKVMDVEIIQLPNKKVDVVWGNRIVLLEVIEGNKRKGSRKIPPEDVNGGARVLGRCYDVNDRVLKGESRGNIWI